MWRGNTKSKKGRASASAHGPVTWALAASLGVHAALLLGLSRAEWGERRLPQPGVIRVSIRESRGGDEADSSAVPPMVADGPLALERAEAVRAPRRATKAAARRRPAAVVAAPVAAAAAPVALLASDGNAGADADAGAAVGGGAPAGGFGGGAGDELGDQRPYCLYCPEPRYPMIARAQGWQGTADVRLRVLADGTVDEPTVRHSSGYGVLDRAAIAAARKSRFHVAGAGQGNPVRGHIRYRFELSAVEE